MDKQLAAERSAGLIIAQKLIAATTLVAVPLTERALGLPDIDLHALEETAREETMRRRSQRDMQREVQREIEQEREHIVRGARLCEICLDKPKDVALVCGHQACAVCAEELANCHICRQLITVRMKVYS